MRVARTVARTLSLLLGLLAALPASSAETPSIGKTIADFKLHDYLGAPHALADFAKSKLVVIAFLGADCPLANRYADRLVEMAGEYGPHDVAFLAIDGRTSTFWPSRNSCRKGPSSNVRDISTIPRTT